MNNCKRFPGNPGSFDTKAEKYTPGQHFSCRRACRSSAGKTDSRSSSPGAKTKLGLNDFLKFGTF